MPETEADQQRGGIDQVQHGQLALKVLAAIMGVGIVALGILASDSPNIADFARRLSVSALSAGAFAFLAALVGFVFGIPRTMQGLAAPPAPDEDGDAASARPAAAAFYHNTNLEDISDWLTKILVGVGLTQLTTMPERVWALAGTIAPGLGTGSHAQILALALVIYYSATGFLFAYLWTRLYFKGALAQADALSLARKVEQTVSRLQAQPSKDAIALNLVGLQLNPGTDSPDVDLAELKKAIVESSSAVKTAIYQQAWEVRSKFWQTDKKRMALSIPVFEGLMESDVHSEYHSNHGQLGWALKDKEPPDWAGAERELSAAIRIRGGWRTNGWLFYEANRALCRIMLSKDAAHSSEITKEDILSDLKVAAHLSAEDNFTLKEPVVLDWLKEQDLSAEDLRPVR